MAITDDGLESAATGERPVAGRSTVDDTTTTGGPPVRPGLKWVRRVLLVLWVLSIVGFLYRDGIPVDRETIIGFTLPGLLIWSLGRRPLWSVFVDWLPFVLVLIVYDYTRGLAHVFGAPTQWHWQIDTDKFLVGGVVPTTWLQEHLKLAQPPVWEVGVSLTYISFYFVPYLVAGWLWVKGRSDFKQFALRFVGLSFIGTIVFIAMPAAPPWAAAQCSAAQVASHPDHPACMNEFSNVGTPGAGLLGPYTSATSDPSDTVDRISSRGFASLGLHNATELLNKGQATTNLVAAIPSLHAATTLMLGMFLWPRVRKGWRILLILYPPAMAFALIYSGEHYLTDILIGWTLAITLELSVRGWQRRRRRRAAVAATQASTPSTVGTAA